MTPYLKMTHNLSHVSLLDSRLGMESLVNVTDVIKIVLPDSPLIMQ